MGINSKPSAELMPAVPTGLRGRILSGMRWTLWLSVLGAPFGYGTSVLLARVGPEVIGTYGLLLVYITLVSSWFYLGGDAVVIKFIPTLKTERRFAFLISYFIVACVGLVPWVAVAVFLPGKLHFLFGKATGASFQALIICLAPIYIVYSLVIASLKATMEFRLAEMLRRLVTIGSFLIYAALLVAWSGLLKAHYTGLIWGIYLGLTALAAVVGFPHLWRMKSWQHGLRNLRFTLPEGFWRFAISLQQVSALGFLVGKMDYILVLNFGGLAMLGKYVAIVTLADIIRTLSRYFLDTLLPSLTNLIASENLHGASQVFSMNLRILFLVSLGVTCGLLFLLNPILSLLGPVYVPLRNLFVLMLLFFGVAIPGTVGGTLLTSVGKQQRSVWVGLFQVGLYATLFLFLWPHYQLLGAVLAYGIALAASNMLLLMVARWSAPIRFPFIRDYAWLILVCVIAGIGAIRFGTLGLVAALPAWLISLGLFLLLARYRLAECRNLVSCFVPVRLKATANE